MAREIFEPSKSQPPKTSRGGATDDVRLREHHQRTIFWGAFMNKAGQLCLKPSASQRSKRAITSTWAVCGIWSRGWITAAVKPS